MAASYATTSDFTKYGLPSDAVTITQDELDAASAIAEGYIRKRYGAPLVQWGTDLRRVVCHIASYDALALRGFNPQRGADQVVLKRYDDAIAWLKMVARGDVELADAIDSTPEEDEASPLVGGGRGPLWDVDGTGGGCVRGDILFDNDDCDC